LHRRLPGTARATSAERRIRQLERELAREEKTLAELDIDEQPCPSVTEAFS